MINDILSLIPLPFKHFSWVTFHIQSFNVRSFNATTFILCMAYFMYGHSMFSHSIYSVILLSVVPDTAFLSSFLVGSVYVRSFVLHMVVL